MTDKSLEKLEAAINFVSEKSNFESGTRYLETLSEFLSSLLEVDYVIINKYRKENPGVAETIAIYTPNGLAANIVYNLVGTPCHNVIGAKLCSYAANLQQLFPKDEFVIQMNAESYVGIPLWDGNRAPIGHIAVMHKEKFTGIKTIELVLKSISAIAGREIERIIYKSKLKASEDRFNLLLQSSEDMITIHEPNGRYIYYNGPSCYAITSDDIVGKMPKDLFNQDEANTLLNAFEKVEKTGKSETIEVLLDWLGAERWFSEYIYPVKNDKDEVIELVKVCKDIHHRKISEQEIERQNKALLKSEKQLLESNEEYQAINEELSLANEELLLATTQIEESEVKFRTIFDHSTDAIVVTKNGRGVFFNPAYLKLLGYKNSDELYGKNITDQVVERERDRVSKYIIDRNTENFAPIYYESIGQRKNGEEFDYEISISTYTLANEKYTLGIIRDITLRKLFQKELDAQNEKLNELNNALNDAQKLSKIGSWEFNLETFNLNWSRETYRIFELEETQTPQDKLYNAYRSKVHPDDIPELDRLINLTSKKRLGYQYEHRVLCKDGSLKCILGIGQPVIDASGKVIAIRGTAQDITQRKLWQKELDDQTDKLYELNNALNDAQKLSKIGSWELDLQTFELIWSLEHYHIFELEETSSDKLYDAYRSKIHPDDLPEFDHMIKLAVEKGLGYEYEHRVLCEDGSIKYILGIGQPLIEASGKAIAIRGTVQDITQRKLFQKELDLQNDKLSELNNALNQAQKLSHVGSWQWDMTTDTAKWSDEMYSIYGVTKENFYPSSENVAKILLPEELAKMEKAIDALLTGKMFTPFEFRIMRPSGEVRTLYIIALEQGAIGGENEKIIFGVTQDITDRKQKEKTSLHLAQIAANSTDMIVLFNLAFEYQAANRTYLNAFDLSYDQLINKHVPDLVGEEYFKNIIMPNVTKCLEGADVHYQLWFDFPKIRKKYMDITYSKYFDNDGFLAGIAINLSDITLRKHAEEKIIRSLEEKELLLRELYHRTKNNMQVISSMLSIQSIYTKNDEVKEMLGETKSRIMGMALVHEKLYQAQDLSWIDLKDYINDLVELLKGSLLSKISNLAVVTNLENTRTNIDTAVPCGLIINELFTNAIKHGFPDNKIGVIKIELINIADEICISVTDNGVGIPTGLDFKNSNSYGLNAVIMLAEHQLGGSLTLNTEHDTEFILKFKETINVDRV
ncbi:MAG: PAS domain S-box-containing protein [Cyclobacteriaceae bacterium]|jgi:PAS domain S-box-containing protein